MSICMRKKSSTRLFYLNGFDNTSTKSKATMKPLQGDSVNNNSYSCTSCDSRSESDRQILKRLLLQGSKINKLLTGKYYDHLRESDLLDKLNKTRALYDALRSQLLSSNESSTGDLKPRQSSREIRKALMEAKKSSDIFALVDLVDKGAVMGLRKLSECCSCCAYSSKFRLYENIQKGRRNRETCAGGNIAPRSSLVCKQETGEAKNIKSDPCTSACFKKEKMKKNRVLIEKVCPAKSIVKRDQLSTPSNYFKLMSIHNDKLRKSYHKLKRAKAYPSPNMENIGEGGIKTVGKYKLATNTIKQKESNELLKIAQKKIKDSIETDRKALQQKGPEVNTTVRNTAEENMSRANKIAIKLKDNVGGNRQAQSSEFKQRHTHGSRKNSQFSEESPHISDTLSTSSTSNLNEILFTTGNERQKSHSRAKKRNKKHTITERKTKISEKPTLNQESYALKGLNQVQNSKESKIPPQKDLADVNKKNKKMSSFSSTQGKELKRNTVTVYVSSIKKKYPASHKKSSSNSFNKINKSNLKTKSSVLFRKRLKLLSAPLRFRPRPLINEEPHQLEEPVRHKKPRHSEELCLCEKRLLQEELRLSAEPGRRTKKSPNVKQKKYKSDSHSLKRCLCSIKFKINETKPKISKKVINNHLNDNDKQIIPSKSLSSVKTLTKASYDDPQHMPDHTIKCDCSEYVKQSQVIRKNKLASQNETNAHLEPKYNVTDNNEPIQQSPTQNIFNKTKLSIHALISDCVCKEVEQFMYKHYGQPNIKFREKLTSSRNVPNKEKLKIQDEHTVIDTSNCIVSKCECFDEDIATEEMGRSKDLDRTNNHLRIKSTLKDASITTEKPRNLQNQSVQTVVNSTSKQKREISLKQLEKKNTFASNPRFCIELLNTGYCNNALTITQSKVKRVYKCGKGINQLSTKQSQTSTTTPRKHGLPKSKNIHSVLKRNKTRLPGMSTHRVRPSFSRKIYNSKRSPCLCSPIDKDSNIKEDIKIDSMKDDKLETDTKSLQKLVLSENTNKEEQNLLVDLTNTRCLRNLKLRKKGKYYSKSNVENADTKSKIIIIEDKIRPGFKKGAKVTKSKYSNQLSKCNPDEYLENNKSNKHFGILTEKTKIKSKSSNKHTLRSVSKLLFVKSDFQQRNPSLQKFKKMRINSESSHLPQYNKKMFLDNFFKQSVKIGSNFSLNIEFYKGTTQNRTKSMNVHFLNNKQESNLLTKRYSSNRITHVGTKKVSLAPNRCFCTLKIPKFDEKLRNSKWLSPFRTKKLTELYAMSTVAIAETKMKTPEILKVDHDFHCIDTYHPISYSKHASSHIKQWQYFNKNPTCGFSISMIAFKAKNIQSYIRESKYKLLQISSREESLLNFDSNEAIRFESAFSCEVDYLKNICSKRQRIIRSAQSQNDSLALSKHNTSTYHSQLTGVQPLLRRCYCTMNIQVARQKRKLLDYECEPGICIPGECDPYECQKLIMKRLMRKVSKMSGTDSRSRSSASGTSLTSSRSRRLQSSLAREPKYRTRGHYTRSRPSQPQPQGLKYQTLPRSSLALAPATAHRQAVKVGSTFSFDIEFSKGSAKSTSPTTNVVKVPKRHVSSRSSTTYHGRGMDRGTRYSGGRHHRETQSMMKQMRHRASSVTPMLKRCFCTLKLQKKGRQQKELELRTIHQGTSTPPEFRVESPVLRTSERGQNTQRKRKFHDLLPYECEPGICIPGECDPYECLELIKRRNKHTKDFGTDSMASSTSSSSMTIGQKRKMKRIQARNIRPKQVRSSHTSVRSKPSAMSIDTVNKQGQDKQIAKPSRQAVKISSNFSFNIEFYKDKTGGGPSNDSDRRPSEVYVHKAPREVRRVPKKVYAQRKMREGSSQSRTSSRDDDSQIGIFQRGQSTMTSGFLKRCFCTAKLLGHNVDAATAARRSPSKLKRCFCTLKLLSKRHRIKGGGVGHERATSVGMTQTRGRGPPFQCVSECEAAVKTQTKERYSSLLPYECEPGVCEPGNCDPYECIKLIRKRLAKEKMTGTEGPRTRSKSSYFSSSNPSRARMTQYRSAWPRTRMTQSRPARRRTRGRRRDYASSESVVQERIVSQASPQRQAVRIGSNFSFNIEFYKDKSPNNLEVQMAAPVVKKYRPVPMRDRGHGAYRKIRTRDRGFRGRRFPSLSRNTQMDSIQSRDIGLGPILRRCFCTLKLQKKSKDKAKIKSIAKAVSIAESKVESKAGSKTGFKAENKAETSTDTKAEAKVEIKTIHKETDSQKPKMTNPNLKCLCDQTNKKNECTCTPPIKEVATLHDKSITTSKKPKEIIVASKKSKKSIVASEKSKKSIVTAKKSKKSIATAKKSKRKFMERPKIFPYKLEPYECEPGICVPGECDPYECLKLINKRLMYSSGTSTDRRDTRSTSNMVVCTNRDCGAQSYIQRKKQMRSRDTYTRYRSPRPKTKMTQPRTARRRRRGRRRDYALSDSVLQEKIVTPASPQRQAVRIGSNFSFNIEFYKDKSPNNLEAQTPAPVVKRYHPVTMRDRGHGAYHRTRTRDRGLRGRRFSSLSRESQMDSIQSRDIGLGPILRRCFCTLKLQQKSKANTKTKAKPVAKAVSKTESKAGSKTGSKTGLKAASKAENKPEATAETKAEAKAETKTIQKETDIQKQKKNNPNLKCLCDQTNKKNECTCTPPIKEVATLHDKSITTSKKPKESIVAAKKTKGSIVAAKNTKGSIIAAKKTKESIVTVKKSKRNISKRRKAFPYKLEPYECEPGICVPGECDPYECLKLINKRLMYSSGTSTDQRGTRSTSNMAVCTNRDCEAQSYIQRKKQMRSKNSYTRYREKRPHRDRRLHRERRPYRERRPESRSSGFRSIDVEKPTKQAVKIGSNFNFDIEFSKDKSNGGTAVVTSKPMRQYVSYDDKPRRTSSRSTDGRPTSYRNKKAQRYRANRDIDSQALGPSMRSTMTGTIAPFLKRCFCTLQLHCKTENQGTPFDCLVDTTKTGKLKSQATSLAKSQAIQLTVKKADKNKRSRKEAQFHDRKCPCPKLLPYECEPGYCVPGECDPYECMKRIKRRMQSKQVGTVYRSRSISSSSNERRKYRPRMKARSYTPNRRKGRAIQYDDQFQDDNSSYRQAEVTSDTKRGRQTVRLGSNFSLDIEFFKDNSPQRPRGPQVNYIAKKNEGKRWSGKRGRVKKLTSTRRMSSDDKNYVRRRGAKRATITRAVSTKSMSSSGKRYNPRDFQSQSEFKRTYSRGIGTPSLKRCFCTLKLEKIGRRRQFKTKIIEPTLKSSSKKMEPSFKRVSKKKEPSFKCTSNKMEPSSKCMSTNTKSKTKAIIEPVAREMITKPKTCECEKGRKGNKCECNKRKINKNCKCYEKCECVEEIPPQPSPKKPSSLFKSKTNDFPCKKGKECKCCKCNTYLMKTSKYRCKKGKVCKCPICNTPAVEPNENIISKNQDQNIILRKQDENIMPVKQDQHIISKKQDKFPCKRGKECKCCKCNTSALDSNEFPCKKGKKCKCCKCNTRLEQGQNIIPVKQDNFPCRKGKECKCSKCKCNSPGLEPNEFPCKKGKNCKCCKCSTYSMKISKYRCKQGEICKCPICNTPGLEPNENKTPMNQNQNIIAKKPDQKIIPVNQDKCKCNTQKPSKCLCDKGSKVKKCECKQNAKNKNCKCFESCECVAETPPKKPSTIFTCKPSKSFTCKTSTVKTSDKKTATKKKYDPLKQLDLRDDCGVCETPYECLKKGLRRMYRPSGKRLKRRKRMSVSSIAATLVPGYTHKRTKYKGEPYSPDQIERIVEEPRYPFLHGKDARQGVKISSNFSFDIEFFKEMLPPVMDDVNEVDEDSPPSYRKGRTKNRITDYHRAGDSNDSESEPDRKSSPFEVLKRCFCTTKLKKSNYTQSLTVGRVQEMRPMSYFGPREYLVQYQIQPARKYFKTNPQGLETIMSYTPSKYNKVYHNKPCYCRRNRVYPTKQGAHGVSEHSEAKQSTLKKMLNFCRNLFTKRSNKVNTNKSEGWTELKKAATSKQPLIDILKASKSERHPNKVATANIKKSKSLKVAKVRENNDYKKKYSRFQSGDHHGSKLQNTGIKLVKKNCKHCQNKFKQTIPIHDKVRFTTLRTAKALYLKPNDAIVTGQKNPPKSVSFLFKSPKFKNYEDIQCLKMCSCCGGIKKIKRNPPASNCLGIKNKILKCSEDTTVIPKDLMVIPTKMYTPEGKTAIPQENKDKNKRECRCYVCKSISKQKTMQDKKDALSVCGNLTYKKPERLAENINHAECIQNKSGKCVCRTTICLSKSEIKAPASGSEYKLAPDQKESYKNLKQEAEFCGYSHTAENKEFIDNDKIKGNDKKLAKDTRCIQLAGKSVLRNQIRLSNTVDILRNLHKTVTIPKSTYQKCQSYLHNHMHAWKKFHKAACNRPGVKTMQRLKLRCQARKCVEEGTEKLEKHPVTNFAVQFNNTHRKKGVHAKKLAWRRHSSSVFGWSPFMLSLRKRPWLSAYYKCAGFFPPCLTILQVWRQFMDIILFMLAAVAVSPCLLGIELCKALKSCFLCTA